MAADMAAKAPAYKVPPPVAVSSWTACYIGVNGGGAWASKATTVTTFNGAPFVNDAGSLTASGGAYGGQVGCDYQINGNWVVGVRGMWDGSSMNGSTPWAAPLAFDTTSYNISSFGTVVGKIGYLVAPTVQLYGLGGVAWVRDRLTWTNYQGTPLDFATGTQTRTGYDVGVGLSWMFAPNWDLWVEYDHMGFGTKNFNLAGVGPALGDSYTADVKQSVDKVLVGIDYRINWDGPVVAKY